MLEPFVGPRLKIARASHHLESLSNLVEDYERCVKVDYIPVTGKDHTWRFEISPALPLEICPLVGDIAHNLRTSLDVLLNDIARVRGVGLSGMLFPISKDHESHDKKLSLSNANQPFKKLGNDVVEAITSLKPYAGGHQYLRGIHDLNNTDKHKLVVPTVSFQSIKPNDALNIALSTLAIGRKSGQLSDSAEIKLFHGGAMLLDRGTAYVIPPTYSDVKVALFSGEEVTTDRGVHASDLFPIPNADLRIAFPRGYPFETLYILETLQRAFESFEQIIRGFSVQFG